LRKDSPQKHKTHRPGTLAAGICTEADRKLYTISSSPPEKTHVGKYNKPALYRHSDEMKACPYDTSNA